MKINQFIGMLILPLAFFSCEKRDLTYKGPTVVEFSNPVSGRNEKLTGQSIGGTSVLGDNPKIPIRGDMDSLIVQLVGPHRNSAVVVDYTVVQGTAVEGRDFEILGTKGKVTIPANSSSGVIRLRLMNNATQSTDVRRVTFNLTGTNQAEVGLSANYVSYLVNIYPMKAYLNKVLGSQGATSGSYFASSTGNVYTDVLADIGAIDIAFTVDNQVPKLISPQTLSGNPLASATKYSARVFTPATTVPAHLLQSYATSQLGALTAVSVNAIPVSGTTAAAAVNDSVQVIENGIYGFVTGKGKKGYIRIKSLTSGPNGSITFDIMVQP